MDQLCYTLNPNEYKDEIDLKGDLSISLFVHYNEDRQIEDINDILEQTITINTIGIILYFMIQRFKQAIFI